MEVSLAVRARVIEQAGHRCGYCRAHQQHIYETLQIEHIEPRARGGSDDIENLWLACSLCNRHKSDKTRGYDPETGRRVQLFMGLMRATGCPEFEQRCCRVGPGKLDQGWLASAARLDACLACHRMLQHSRLGRAAQPTRLVLVGAGHAHLEVLRRCLLTPLPKVELSVVSLDAYHYYSGMLPGYVAGTYPPDAVRVDVAGLVRRARGRFIEARAHRSRPGQTDASAGRSRACRLRPDLVQPWLPGCGS